MEWRPYRRRSIGSPDRRRPIQIWIRHRYRVREGPEGAVRRHRPLHLGQEERAGMDARMAPGGLSPLADDEEPTWARVNYPKIDYQDLYYYAAPKPNEAARSRSTRSIPRSSKTYEKLGIPLREAEVLAGVEGARKANRRGRRGVRFGLGRDHLPEGAEGGRRHLPADLRGGPRISRAGAEVSRHGRAAADNYFATLNCAVFSDGTFVYIPQGVRCPMELSTYFRINARNTGQFERTLIIADKGATSPISRAAPRRSATRTSCTPRWSSWSRSTMPRSNIRPCRTGIPAMPRARAASTISSPSAATARARTRRCPGPRSRPARRSPGNIRAASCAARIRVGEFYSIAVTNNHQQADTGTKMIHLGKNTTLGSSRKGIAAGSLAEHLSRPRPRPPQATGARNFTQCDSLLIGDKCGAHTVPYIEVKNSSAQFEHEATTSKISDDQLFYCVQRGLEPGGGGRPDRQRLRARTCCSSCRWNSRSRRRS